MSYLSGWRGCPLALLALANFGNQDRAGRIGKLDVLGLQRRQARVSVGCLEGDSLLDSWQPEAGKKLESTGFSVDFASAVCDGALQPESSSVAEFCFY